MGNTSPIYLKEKHLKILKEFFGEGKGNFSSWVQLKLEELAEEYVNINKIDEQMQQLNKEKESTEKRIKLLNDKKNQAEKINNELKEKSLLEQEKQKKEEWSSDKNKYRIALLITRKLPNQDKYTSEDVEKLHKFSSKFINQYKAIEELDNFVNINKKEILTYLSKSATLQGGSHPEVS